MKVTVTARGCALIKSRHLNGMFDSRGNEVALLDFGMTSVRTCEEANNLLNSANSPHLIFLLSEFLTGSPCGDFPRRWRCERERDQDDEDADDIDDDELED